jgi:hypothetical protein
MLNRSIPPGRQLRQATTHVRGCLSLPKLFTLVSRSLLVSAIKPIHSSTVTLEGIQVQYCPLILLITCRSQHLHWLFVDALYKQGSFNMYIYMLIVFICNEELVVKAPLEVYCHKHAADTMSIHRP